MTLRYDDLLKLMAEVCQPWRNVMMIARAEGRPFTMTLSEWAPEMAGYLVEGRAMVMHPTLWEKLMPAFIGLSEEECATMIAVSFKLVDEAGRPIKKGSEG